MNTRDPFFRLPLTELTPMRELIQAERDQEMAEHEAQQSCCAMPNPSPTGCAVSASTAVRLTKPPCSTKSTPSSQKTALRTI